MNRKSIITTLALLLVFQTALIVYLYRPGQNKTAPAVNLMASLDVQSITSMEITDENGKAIRLQKDASTWSVGSENYPADASSVERILNKVIAVESARLVSTTKSSHNRLKVGDEVFNRKVVLGSKGDDFTFYLGTAPSSKSVHIRLSGQNDVYQVAGLSAWELQPEKDSWWKTKYVAFTPESIQSLSVSNASGKINLSRTGEDKKWSLAGEAGGELDQNKVASLVGAVANISISEYQNKDFTIKVDPVCTVDYTIENKSISLKIWPKDTENEDHTAKLSSAGFYAKIRAYIVKDILDASVLSLLVEKPLPGPLPETSVKEEQ